MLFRELVTWNGVVFGENYLFLIKSALVNLHITLLNELVISMVCVRSAVVDLHL